MTSHTSVFKQFVTNAAFLNNALSKKLTNGNLIILDTCKFIRLIIILDQDFKMIILVMGRRGQEMSREKKNVQRKFNLYIPHRETLKIKIAGQKNQFGIVLKTGGLQESATFPNYHPPHPQLDQDIACFCHILSTGACRYCIWLLIS